MDKQRNIALVDCDNFFVSCERVFRPDLEGKPVVVLSSNDGCVISRSKEVKAMGIKMGIPWFQVKDQYPGIIPFSSNFPLYADISSRVKCLLAEFSPTQEVYSIDESFLDLTGFSDVWDRAFAIREACRRQLGIPVCVGIAPTKTLAKLANHIAKKHPRSRGVFSWNRLTDEQKDRIMASLPVDEVWGIGRRLNESLNRQGIRTVLDLAKANQAVMRRRYGIVLDRIITELKGEPCLDIVEVHPPRQQILSSRSFGKPISDFEGLANAVAYHATHVAESLRKERTLANLIQVFIETDRFRTDKPVHCPQICLALESPTDNTSTLVRKAVQGLEKIVMEKVSYKKAGVCASELEPKDQVNQDFFTEVDSPIICGVMDDINRRFGAGTLRVCRNDLKNRDWRPKTDSISPAYTTDFKQVPECR